MGQQESPSQNNNATPTHDVGIIEQVTFIYSIDQRRCTRSKRC